MSLSEQAWMVQWVFRLSHESFPSCELVFNPQTLIFSDYGDYISYCHAGIKIELLGMNDEDYDYHVYFQDNLVKRGSFSRVQGIY